MCFSGFTISSLINLREIERERERERDRERERENLRVHFWILKGLDAMHDRPQIQKTFLVDVLLNEVNLTFYLNTMAQLAQFSFPYRF